jgi:hypothetical protein
VAVAWTGPAVIVLAFLIPGPREVVLIALVFLALYGRSGARLLMMTRYGRSVQPWLRLVGLGAKARPKASRPAAVAARPWRRGRWFWAFTLVAAAAAAAWVATRMAILGGPGPH